MTDVFIDSDLSDDERRARLYAGDLFVFAPSEASTRLCAIAREMLEEAFAPHHPEVAQHHMPVEDYAALLVDLKPRFIHDPRCKEAIAELLPSLGCDADQVYFDVPRLRSSTSGGYLTSGIAYAFHPHRDTWYSAPPCQINWWLPVYEVAPENAMAFHCRYFDEAIANGSAGYDYYRWNRESRRQAASQIGKDTRKQPHPEEPVDRRSDLRVVTRQDGILAFSAAHLHSSVPNDTGRTRFSIDFRTVHVGDARARVGAPNVDSECTGTAMRDFLRARDLERVPEPVAELYDTAPPPADAELVYEPNLK